MKKTLKLIPAIVMLLISAILVSTSTYAWFSMNTQVTATGMQVKAQAEGGIVISNESGADWKATTTASHNTTVALAPTSTADVVAWYHNTSDDANSAKSGQEASTYETLNLTLDAAAGVGYVEQNTNTTYDSAVETAYYLLNKFYIKSSADAINPATLYINKVKATGPATSVALDSSLRIAIKVGGQVYIYAPVDGATLTYKAKNTTNVTATASVANDGVVNTTATGVASIPNNAATIGSATNAPLEVLVYIFFEGEDANCKSSNITTSLDTLTVEVTFGTTTIPTT